MLHLSAEEFVELFAEDACYEFPFLTPGRPASYSNRAEIYQGFKRAWDPAPVRLDAIEDVVIYDAVDPSVLIAEQNMRATVLASGEQFVRAAVLIITARAGLIVRVRDYSDALRGVRQMGRTDALISAINREDYRTSSPTRIRSAGG
jgi:ketosteroid isomerase-like protein